MWKMALIRCARQAVVVAALVLPMLLTAAPAEAGFLPGFYGNTFPTNVGRVDGHVNFAVFDRTGPAGDRFGTGLATFDSSFVGGSGPFDTSAGTYLYLFQTINDGTDTKGVIATNQVEIDSTLVASVTSYGFFRDPSSGKGVGFFENGALSKGFGPYLGGASAAAGNPSPAFIGPGGGSDVPGMGLFPNTTPFTTAVGPTGFLLGFDFLLANFGAGLPPGRTSRVWGYTIHVAPTYGNTSITSMAGTADGRVPTPQPAEVVPEPSSLALMGLGGFGLLGGWLYWRRRLRISPSMA